MTRRAWLALLAPALLALGTACGSLASIEETPVPGAAATAARAAATAIPTPVRAPASPSASAAPAPARSAAPAPSARPAGSGVTDDDVARVQREMQAILGVPELPGVERWLLDRVSLGSAEGGEVLERTAAAAWLRERAAPGMRVVSVDRSALAVVLEVRTEGWSLKPPIATGRVTFNLHRFLNSGAQDDERGDWKIDVIAAE